MTKSLPPLASQPVPGGQALRVTRLGKLLGGFEQFFRIEQEQLVARNRRAMLTLVRNTWIRDVLDRSLYRELVTELAPNKPHDEADPRWDIQLKIPGVPDRALAPGTAALQVADELGGAVLILGEPGAGKTTTLLELARDAIVRAEQDPSQPIPVVFNLSSWSDSQQ